MNQGISYQCFEVGKRLQLDMFIPKNFGVWCEEGTELCFQ